MFSIEISQPVALTKSGSQISPISRLNKVGPISRQSRIFLMVSMLLTIWIEINLWAWWPRQSNKLYKRKRSLLASSSIVRPAIQFTPVSCPHKSIWHDPIYVQTRKCLGQCSDGKLLRASQRRSNSQNQKSNIQSSQTDRWWVYLLLQLWKDTIENQTDTLSNQVSVRLNPGGLSWLRLDYWGFGSAGGKEKYSTLVHPAGS